MAARVTFRGDALKRLLESEDGPVAKHLARLALQVERRAKALAPVDTGRLRSSITWELGRDEQGLVARIGSNVEYAAYQEFGTRTVPASPYLRPALDAVVRRGGGGV